MRHGKRFNHLGRTAPHRKAMLSNMASSLILHKRISTTVAKAKALRQYVEPLITKSKTDSTHSRRVVFSYLQDKDTVRELFDEISEKINERPGGYTRIIKTGNRLGDNAEMCIMELVDYNELLLDEKDTKKSKTRRSRRGGKKSTEETAAVVTSEKEAKAKVEKEVVAEQEVEAVETAEVVEEVADPKVEEVTSEADAKVEEEPKDEAPKAADDEDTKKE
jgi:large subunit ribosomal protein L17